VQIAQTSDDVITQFRDPHTLMIDFRHADKCCYSAAGIYSPLFGTCAPILHAFVFVNVAIRRDAVWCRYMSSLRNSSCWRCESRDPEVKVISTSLYGSGKRYTVGAIRNAQLLPVIFPGWRLWIHCELPQADTSTRYIDHTASDDESAGAITYGKPSGKILQTAVYDDCESICEQWSRRANGREVVGIKGCVRSRGLSSYGCNANPVEGKQQSVRRGSRDVG